MGRLDAKVAIVTGAGRGHAEAVARRFAKEGAAVSICDVLSVKELEDKVARMEPLVFTDDKRSFLYPRNKV